MRSEQKERARLPDADRHRAGKVLGQLYLAAGVLTMSSVLLPKPPGFQALEVLLVGLIATAAGAALMVVPWHRLPHVCLLAMAGAAFGLIGWHNYAGGADAFRYGIFFMLVFVWLGLFEPPGTSLKFAPLAAVAYVVPLVLVDARASDYASVAYAIPLNVAVGEVLAGVSCRLRDLQERLRHLAGHDRLTGLPNRTAFEERLARECSSGYGSAVVFIDLDDFKRINDRHGHAAGDRVLIEVAEALKAVVRPGDLVCRLSGDEFIVLVTGADPQAIAQSVAARAAALIEGIRCPDGGHMSASIGIACDLASACDRRLLAAADAAMYEAKRAGKGRVVLIEPVASTQAVGEAE